MTEFFDAVTRALLTGLPFPIGIVLAAVWYVFGFAVAILLMIAIAVFGIAYFVFIYCWPIGVPLAVILLIYKWETLVRWYYQFTPHPAASSVHAAIRSGAEIDGAALASMLRPVPSGRIEKEVRAEQAAKLAELARAHTEGLERQAEALRERIREEAAYQAANRSLQDAAIEQQLAQRRAEVLAEIEEFLRRGGKDAG